MPRAWQGEHAAGARAADAEANRDILVRLFAKTDFAQGVLASLQSEGYAVLPGVFSREEAECEYDRMWGFVEKVSPTVRRGAPETWHGHPDPWPYAQRDMMQLHQAGWVFGDLRERYAERVYEKLYGTRELHSSKDGFTFQRPTSKELARTPNDHFDQGLDYLGLHCVQGSVALTDQEESDGCFLCWPGSHRFREAILAEKGPSKARKDFIIISEADKEMLRRNGISERRVPVQKGDVVLWRSDLCHCGAPPLGARPGFRAVVYICCLPAVLTPDSAYPQKARAYQRLETGSHWPIREEWFEATDKHYRLPFRPYFDSPPELTPRLRELYGLVRYGGGGGAGAEEGEAAATNPPAASATPSPSPSPPGQRRWRKRKSDEDVSAAPTQEASNGEKKEAAP